MKEGHGETHARWEAPDAGTVEFLYHCVDHEEFVAAPVDDESGKAAAGICPDLYGCN